MWAPSRPDHTPPPLSDDEEWARLEPVLQPLVPHYPGRISVDSYHPATIEKALRLGDILVNDVTGFQDPAMIRLAVEWEPRIIISHLPAPDPQTAHQQEPIDSAEQMRADLLATVDELISLGMSPQQIILDPGIGFGKTIELNWELLRFAELVPEYPVLIGHSRKRFLGEDRMETEPNLAAAQIAIESGAAYLRIHDVAAHAKLAGIELGIE